MKTPKSPEVKYRKQLLGLASKLRNDVNTQIVPLLRQLQPEYVNDSKPDVNWESLKEHIVDDEIGSEFTRIPTPHWDSFNDAYARTLEEAFNRLRRSYSDINENAQIVANSFVTNSNQVNKQRFYSSMEDAVGINLQSVLQNEGLEDVLIATTRENVSLIRSIPEEYFKNIESIVFSGTTQGSTAGSMIEQISKQGKVTNNRAKLIARDQSSKLNSALTQQRSQNLGSEEYIWRTSGDERVRSSHSKHNGKVFRWDDPPKDTGHPGQDIQCRCVAQAIIKL